jgi:hypothetical protein
MWRFTFLGHQLILAVCKVGQLQQSLPVTAFAQVVVVAVVCICGYKLDEVGQINGNWGVE